MTQNKELQVEILQNALVTPLTRTNRIMGGIYDEQGKLHTKSLLKRSYGQVQFAEENYHPDPQTSVRHVKKGIYGGNLIMIDHYGHFLLEILSRVWALTDYPEEDVYFHSFSNVNIQSFSDLKSWQQELFAAALVNPKRLHFIEELTHFDELIVPEAGYVIQNYCHPKQALALAELGQRLQVTTKATSNKRKIWLSRSGLKKGAIAGELDFEVALLNEGFEILHPEQLSVADQVQTFADDNVIAGFTGSAFHTLLLSKATNIKLLHFSRIGNINRNYYTCAKTKGIEAQYYNFFIKKGKIQNIDANVLQNLEAIWQVLYEQGLVKNKTYHASDLELKLQKLDAQTKKSYPILFNRKTSMNQIANSQETNNPNAAKPRPVNHSVRRIKTLAEALNAQSYLEIGVNRGVTFLNVPIMQKTAVDPKFLFDTTLITDSNVILKEMTSDDFFSTLPTTQKYNIIFIDGLHTFEQTYRDLCNSLLHANDRTVFLIDDTKPNDVYSSFPHQRKAVNYRRQAGGVGPQWHGDVFKVIFALHDFHPGLNYRTIVGSGNSQTLVWRSNAGWRKPLFNCLEKISRLSYFDLLDHIEILRESSEEQAISFCLNELASL